MILFSFLVEDSMVYLLEGKFYSIAENRIGFMQNEAYITALIKTIL